MELVPYSDPRRTGWFVVHGVVCVVAGVLLALCCYRLYRADVIPAWRARNLGAAVAWGVAAAAGAAMALAGLIGLAPSSRHPPDPAQRSDIGACIVGLCLLEVVVGCLGMLSFHGLGQPMQWIIYCVGASLALNLSLLLGRAC